VKETAIDSTTRRVIDDLRLVLQTIFGAKCKKIMLYGSYARGEQEPFSDMDIMVIVDMDKEELRSYDDLVFDRTYDLTLKYGILLSIMTKSEKHFLHWVNVLPFYANVRNEGIEFHAS
jgi:predicted nucleotidyltransferase